MLRSFAAAIVRNRVATSTGILEATTISVRPAINPHKRKKPTPGYSETSDESARPSVRVIRRGLFSTPRFYYFTILLPRKLLGRFLSD